MWKTPRGYAYFLLVVLISLTIVSAAVYANITIGAY